MLLVTPLVWVYRRVLTPVGREVAAAIGVAWRIAGFVSRAVGRALAWLAWHLVGAPVAWAYRTVCTPSAISCATPYGSRPGGQPSRRAGRPGT